MKTIKRMTRINPIRWADRLFRLLHRKSKTTTNCHVDLPRDIILDILSRLPSELIFKCQCESRSLQVLTTTPFFIHMQSSYSKKKNTNKTPSGGEGEKASYVGMAKIFGEVFKKFDEDGDGKLSYVDLGLILSSSGYAVTTEELQALVEKVDSDGDGLIDLNEFLVLNGIGSGEQNTNQTTSGGEGERARYVTMTMAFAEVFNKFDEDGDGRLSYVELGLILRNSGYEVSAEVLQAMVAKVDSDGDGLIDLNEFLVLNEIASG